MNDAAAIKALKYMLANPKEWNQGSYEFCFAYHIGTQAGLKLVPSVIDSRFYLADLPETANRDEIFFIDRDYAGDSIINVEEAATAIIDPSIEDREMLVNLFEDMSQEEFWIKLGFLFPQWYKEVKNDHMPELHSEDV